jgi:nitrate reductase gamma subunit
MDLLQFAKGPALEIAFAIFAFGIAYRLFGVVVLNWPRNYSESRGNSRLVGALKMMALRSWPHREFLPRTWYSEVIGYAFHIGFFVVFLLFVPHIVFIKTITGLSWPGLPGWAIYYTSLITVLALLAVLVRRLNNPVIRMLSNFDDYFSWFMTISPVITGLMVTAHMPLPYETLLAIHILNVALLMIWFPFGKIMHAFFIWSCRGVTGASFARKGVPVQ